QGEVAFQAGAGRADADQRLAAQPLGGGLYRLIQAERDTAAQRRPARPVIAVHIAIAEAATVAEKILVHVAVVAVFDPAQFAVAFAGADIAAGRAAVADTRRELHVPFAVVAFGVSLVGEDAGRTDFGQVAGEFAFQRAVCHTAEVQVVVRAIHPQVRTAGVVLVITHAAIAGDAAVHFVADKGAEFLILVRALGETVAAHVV